MPPKPPSPSSDWILRANPEHGIERVEAWFQGKAYGMHRHDTYAIGRTLAGVQSFQYRRSRRDSLPGNTLILHPDEAHDGQAGTDEGFRYRIVYIEPSLFQEVLGGRALPFVEGGVTTDPRLAAATGTLLQSVGQPLDPLEQAGAIAELAHALAAVAGLPDARGTADYAAARRARDYLREHCTRPLKLEEVEAATGRDRWSLSHDFRTFYGTSPYRYLTMRRLDVARRLLIAGEPLSSAAIGAGFADQAHMTRQFAQAFGITPGRWRRMTAARPRG